MKRHTPLILLTLLALLVSGCEIFPYVNQPIADATAISPEPSATRQPTNPPPTATLAFPVHPSPTLIIDPPTDEPADPTQTTMTPTFTLQEGIPITLPNFNHPKAGCDWLGVAGQVFDQGGLEVLGLTVLVGDDQSPGEEPLQAYTGDAIAYGLGGFEIQMGEKAINTSERFWIQVLNAEGVPLTARHHFSTFEDCEKNLVLINFVRVTEDAQEKSAPTATIEAYP